MHDTASAPPSVRSILAEPALALTFVFCALVRLAIHVACGLAFDANANMWQMQDVVWLRDSPVEAIWRMHMQPPLLNALYAVSLQLPTGTGPIFLQSLFVIASALMEDTDPPTALVAVGRFGDGAQPYAARLLLRDGARTPGPYLDRWGGGATARLPLDRRIPPRLDLEGYMAEARAPAGDLVPKGGAPGWAFRFPPAAAQALSHLDPREAVAVEFLFPGDGVRRAYVEVGDFAAGEAFLKVASR